MDSFESVKKFLAEIRDRSGLKTTDDGLLRFDATDATSLMNSVAAIREDHKKERLRLAIKTVFDLDSKDMVIFRQNEIFIKRFNGEALINYRVIDVIKEAVKATEHSPDSHILSDTLTISLAEFGNDVFSIPEKAKDKIRQKLKEQIKLSDKDLILFLNDKVVIRRFKKRSDDSESSKREQRFNGLPKEELAVLKKSLFENEETEQAIVTDIIKTLLKGEFDFSRITHAFFTKNYVKIMQRAIFDFLKENLSEEDFVLDGLTNFILRDNWIIAHTTMAIHILELIGSKNANAENFLKYYSGDIEVDADRNKFKLPEIIDKNGMKWTLPATISVVMQRKKAIEQLAAKQKTIDDMKASIEELYSKMDELNEESIGIEKEFSELDRESKEKAGIEAAVNAEIRELKELLKRCKEEDKAKIQADMSDKTLYLKKLMIKEDTHFTRAKKLEHQNKTIATKIEKINFDIGKIQKRCKEEEEKLYQFSTSQQGSDEKYELLMEALAVALMKKKTRI